LIARAALGAILDPLWLWLSASPAQEIAAKAASARPFSEIASKLKRSVKTIESHRAAIKTKLGLRSSLELIRYAANMRPDLPSVGAEP
jgi:DNA-binding CsgD family transcriptional regulator